MARKVFYSFHYVPDHWRASQVRQMGAIEGDSPVSDNDWEKVTKGGDAAIKKWIDDQMVGRTCAVVLAGTNTAGRKWIDYEIKKAWDDGKGVLAIHIHNLKNSQEQQVNKGGNPLSSVLVGKNNVALSTIAKSYDPPFSTSTNVYNHIKTNLATWVEDAIKIRNAN